jgi:Sec-independent protein translocase protein TatA
MFGLGIPELLVILAIVALIAGPTMVKHLTKSAVESVKAVKEIKKEVKDAERCARDVGEELR